ncbi:MAG: nucleotide exchange factor GrpE [Candidatus Thorarchaeota archaeon]
MNQKKDNETNVPTAEKNIEKNDSSTEQSSENNLKELNEGEIAKESTEIKQIEGKEPEKLEYYSKEHLIEKVSKLEKEFKKNTKDLKKAKEEAESWKNKYTRLQAEFENAQKRWDKTRKNLRLEYTASVLKGFLPLYDSFKKALSDDEENLKVLKGFYDQYMNILKSHKAQPMDVKENEQFDYSSQEALTSIEKADIPKNTILEVVQDGWKLENEVLRYAKVIISKEPKPPEPEPEPELELVSEVESEPNLESTKVNDEPKQAKDNIKDENSNISK